MKYNTHTHKQTGYETPISIYNLGEEIFFDRLEKITCKNEFSLLEHATWTIRENFIRLHILTRGTNYLDKIFPDEQMLCVKPPGGLVKCPIS